MIEEQSTDTLIHLQYPTGLPGARAAASVKTPSAWEYDIEDGTYRITVSVGDPEYLDSNHVINLEGETVISSFVPTEDNLFTEATEVVEVTDGKLTLDADGGFNTKLNFIEIEPVDGDSIEDSTDVEETIPIEPENGETSADSVDTNEGDDSESDTTAGGDDSEESPIDSTEVGAGDGASDPIDSTDGGDDGITSADSANASDSDGTVDSTGTDSSEIPSELTDTETDDGAIDLEGSRDLGEVDPEGTGSDLPEDIEDSEGDGNILDANGDIEVGIPVEGGGVVEPIQPIDTGINFNFGVPRVDSPAGFIQDVGEGYDTDRGFGWVTQDSARSDNLTPIDVVVNGRDRDTLFNDGRGNLFQEPVRDSLIHMQYPTGLPNSSQSVITPAAWEYEIANGQYEVTVGVGDPTFFDSNHVINIEGENVISGFTPEGFEVNGGLPLGAQAFDSGSAIVEVDDGRLTVDAIGGENTKINYISIVPIDTV